MKFYDKVDWYVDGAMDVDPETSRNSFPIEVIGLSEHTVPSSFHATAGLLVKIRLDRRAHNS